MKKVLFICDKNECASFGRLTINMCNNIRNDYETHVLWLKTPKFFPNESAEKNKSRNVEGCISHEVWAKSLYTGFLSYRNPLKEIIGKVKPDFVYFIRPELGFLVPVVKRAFKSFGLKDSRIVMFVHDTFAETLYPHSIKFILLNKFYIKHCVDADYFVYNSKWTRGQAADHFGPKMANAPGYVVGSPCNADLYYLPEKPITAEERAAFRRKHGMRNYYGMCLNVSLDEPRKNIDTYLNMAALRPDIAFARIGKYSERIANIINEKKLYNVFHFERLDVKEMREFYCHADLMVFPSLLEGFGLPPMEAIACGTPAVCSGTSAIKELMEGVCPLIDNPTDAEAYAKVLDRVMAGEKIVDDEAAKKLLFDVSMEQYGKRVLDSLKIFESIDD